MKRGGEMTKTDKMLKRNLYHQKNQHKTFISMFAISKEVDKVYNL